MPTWPASLPCAFLSGSVSYNPFSTSIPVDVEVGPPLTRNRYTGEMADVSGPLPALSRAQAVALYQFWRDDLVKGTLPFTWTDPLTLEDVNFILLQPPAMQQGDGADIWHASLTLRRVPT